MRILLLNIFLLFSFGGDEGNLTLAQKYFDDADYVMSMKHYRMAIQEYPNRRDQIHYNIAQCLVRIDSLELALEYFHKSINRQREELASLATNNIGAILVKQKKYKPALVAFKSALLYFDGNEKARYNYELLKEKLDSMTPPPPKPPKNPPPKSEPEEDPNEPQPLPPSRQNSKEFQDLIQKIRLRLSQNTSTNDKAQPLVDTLTVRQAEHILDLMRREDVQFIQQLRKTVATSTKKNRRRPDW